MVRSLMTIREKTAIVTGASRGIVQAVAECLGRNRAAVVVNHHHHNKEAAEEVVTDLCSNT